MSKLLRSLTPAWMRLGPGPDAAGMAAVQGLRPATVVTGASRGIGLALAKRFSDKGDAVVLVARHPGPLAEAVEDIRARGTDRVALAVAVDITEATAFAQIAAALTAQGLYLDVLINNAAIGLGGLFVQQREADLDRLVQLNIAALTRLSRQALPDMLARRRGGLINLASLGGYVPGPYQAAYYASKAYVLSLSEALAAECAGSGVRVTAVAPGPVETSFHGKMGAESALYRRILPGLTPETVAAVTRRGFGLGRRVIVPGLVNMLGWPLLRVMPHLLVVPIMGWLLKPGERRAADDAPKP